MTLEQLVLSLELCKELKENGYPQDESFFEYRLFDLGGKLTWSKPMFRNAIAKKMGLAQVGFGDLASPTSSEIGEQLPDRIHPPGDHWCGDSRVNSFYLEVEQRGGKWQYFYTNGEENVWHKYPDWDTETNARAKLWLHLKKNNLLGDTK